MAAGDLERLVRGRIEESIESQRRLLEGDHARAIAAAAAALTNSYRKRGKLLVFGNGGSAADAQHLAAEFLGRFLIDRAALPALALTTNGSALTAIGNDYSFDEVFARQVEALARPGDVVIGISTSGSSKNVLAGLRAGRDRGAVSVALTGRAGAGMREAADHLISVPADSTPRIQESHILVAHVLCEMVESALFPASPQPAAVFIDRDGTINVKPPESRYVRSWSEFEFLPGAKEAIALLARRTRPLIVVTNQRGVALGRMSESDLADIHGRMRSELAAAGARVDAIYHCPHEKGTCECRKPGTGLFHQAANDFPGLALDRSIVIGDSPTDMEAADRIGARGLMVGSGACKGAPTFPSLLEAARWLASDPAGSAPSGPPEAVEPPRPALA